MGLDFTWKGCDWEATPRWSYSGFADFRRRVASSVGVDLGAMAGFGRSETPVPWATVKTPLKWFLNHSDCEGTIGPKRCAAIAPALEDVLKGWKDDYDRREGLRLVNAMRECASKGVSLVFC